MPDEVRLALWRCFQRARVCVQGRARHSVPPSFAYYCTGALTVPALLAVPPQVRVAVRARRAHCASIREPTHSVRSTPAF